jgi:hypothetical protein
VWNGRNRQVLFRGSGGECNRGLSVLRLQGRKILQNLFERIAVSQAGQDCPQSYACAFEDGLSPADRWVADDSVFIVLQIASWAAQWIASLLSIHFITPECVYVDAIYLAAVKLHIHAKTSRPGKATGMHKPHVEDGGENGKKERQNPHTQNRRMRHPNLCGGSVYGPPASFC